MLLACPSPTGTPYISSARGQSGCVVITAPFIISGDENLMSSLSITGELTVTAAGLDGSLTVSSSFTDSYSGQIYITAPLSGMESETVQLRIPAATGLDSSIRISTALSPLTSGGLTVQNTLGDYGVSGSAWIMTPFGRTDLTGRCLINLPSASAKLIKDTLQIYADGADITRKLVKASIDIFLMAVTAQFRNMLNIPDTLRIVINGQSYSFETVSSTSDGLSVSINGEQSSSQPKTYAHRYAKASDLCAESGEVIFAGYDFVAGDISGSYTTAELAEMLADASGDRVRRMPDGRCMIFDISDSNPQFRPGNIISISRKSPKRKTAGVQVTYGRSGDSYISIEPSMRKTTAGRSVDVKVYGASGKKLSTDADGVKLVSSGVKETFTEKVLFENGKGKLTRPAETVLTYGVTADGKDVSTGTSCLYMTVTYQSVCDTYQISSETDADVTICAYMDNTVLLLGRNDGEIASLSAPHTTDRVTALRLAKAYMQSTGEKISVQTPHSEQINTTDGLNILTPHGRGALIGGQIDIQTDPVQITDTLEVLWQR